MSPLRAVRWLGLLPLGPLMSDIVLVGELVEGTALND